MPEANTTCGKFNDLGRPCNCTGCDRCSSQPDPAGPVEYVNLTPHDITVYDPDGTVTTYPPAGPAARIFENAYEEPGLDGHRRVNVRLGALHDLPPARPGVVHIVSMPCAMALAAAGINRPDVVYPYDLYRDETGRTLGACALARIVVKS